MRNVTVFMLAAIGAAALTTSLQVAAFSFDGKEWAQPADFVGFSWDQVTTVCPSGGGLCSGSISGLAGARDFTGFTWPTIEEVASLFRSVEPRRH